MKNLAQISITFGLVAGMLATATPFIQAQPARFVLAKVPPNFRVDVERQSGVCPNTMGLWTWFRNYAGGGEYIVVADTRVIAGSARAIAAQDQTVEYVAPLRGAYASCIGQASSRQAPWYEFRFESGNVYFRVDPAASPETAQAAFISQNLIESRPYVRWAVAKAGDTSGCNYLPNAEQVLSRCLPGDR
jgi:hypothetical protein